MYHAKSETQWLAAEKSGFYAVSPPDYDIIFSLWGAALLFMFIPVFGGQSAIRLIVTPVVTALTRLLLGF